VGQNPWKGANQKLPSVRALAEEHGVALATAARALEVLHGKGIVKPHERSGAYLVAEGPPARDRVDHWAVCLRITPGPWQQGSMAVAKDGFTALAHTPGARLSFDAIPNDLDVPEDALRQTVGRALEAGVSGLFFLPSRINEALMRQDERLLAVCRDSGLPVVLIERNLRGARRALEWDLVCSDYYDGGLQCAMHLFATGRRKLVWRQASFDG
jgi:LacI family transcriptional regulator